MSDECHLNGKDHDWQEIGLMADRNLLRIWCKDCGGLGIKSQATGKVEWEAPRNGRPKNPVGFLAGVGVKPSRFERKEPL